jgi:hypothetical protein
MRSTKSRVSEVRRWVVLGAALATMFAWAVALGDSPTPCREAYLISGLSMGQMSFEEFRRVHGDLCFPELKEGELQTQ